MHQHSQQHSEQHSEAEKHVLGHELQFGTFITPGENPPETAVSLALLSEQLGFDLVTFQDHPYLPGFLNMWTLMTWVAAQTERVQISCSGWVHTSPECCA